MYVPKKINFVNIHIYLKLNTVNNKTRYYFLSQVIKQLNYIYKRILVYV